MLNTSCWLVQLLSLFKSGSHRVVNIAVFHDFRLSLQVRRMRPPTSPGQLPAASDVWAWCDEGIRLTKQMIADDQDT